MNVVLNVEPRQSWTIRLISTYMMNIMYPIFWYVSLNVCYIDCFHRIHEFHRWVLQFIHSSKSSFVLWLLFVMPIKQSIFFILANADYHLSIFDSIVYANIKMFFYSSSLPIKMVYDVDVFVVFGVLCIFLGIMFTFWICILVNIPH